MGLNEVNWSRILLKIYRQQYGSGMNS